MSVQPPYIELAKNLAPVKELYPDVVAKRSLATALQDEFESANLKASARSLDLDFIVLAIVGERERKSQVNIATDERLFIFDFWDKGVCLAHGSTPELNLVAAATDFWVSSSITTNELHKRFPFVRPEPKAEAYETGRATEWKWQYYIERFQTDEHFSVLSDFANEAIKHQKLRQLYPFTSLITFHFSLCTGYPFYTKGCPWVRPLRNGQYEILLSSDDVGSKEKLVSLGTGNAQEAVALVKAHLPPGCGPARAGTADQFEAN